MNILVAGIGMTLILAGLYHVINTYNKPEPQADIKKTHIPKIDLNDPVVARQVREYEEKRKKLWVELETPNKQSDEKERLG